LFGITTTLDQMKLTGKLMVQLIPALPVGSGSYFFPVHGTHQVEWSMKALSNVNHFWSSTLAEVGHPAGRARHAVVNALTPQLRSLSSTMKSNNSCRSARGGPASDKTSWLSHWIKVLTSLKNCLSLCLTSQGQLGRELMPTTLLFGSLHLLF